MSANRWGFLMVAALLSTGCGASFPASSNSSQVSMSSAYPRSPTQYSDLSAEGAAMKSLAQIPELAASGDDTSIAVEQLDSSQVAKTAAESLDRKIIYTATLRVEVTNFDGIPERILQLVESHGGYISETRVGQMQGKSRSGSWKIRVPVDRYRDFLQSAGGLGVPSSLSENAQDVSEEYVDVEARIASGRRLEENVLKLLEREHGKIEDLVAIERELSRIRLDTERLEGRLRFLQNQVALSTVDLNVMERVTFIPDAQPALGQRIQVEWSEALLRLRSFYERTVLGIIANAFVILAWGVAALIALVIYRFVRRRARRRRGAAVATTG